MDALRRLADAGLPATERADALYALAELELARPEDREAGLETLAQAGNVELRAPRTLAALRAAAAAAPGHEGVVEALIEAARIAGDDAALLDALALSARLAGITQDRLEEAVELATRRREDDRARALLLRAVEVEQGPGQGEGQRDLAGALWALRRLVALTRVAGDHAEAARFLLAVERAAPPDEARGVTLELAALCAGPLADLEGAARAYKRLWEESPPTRPCGGRCSRWCASSATRRGSTRCWPRWSRWPTTRPSATGAGSSGRICCSASCAARTTR